MQKLMIYNKILLTDLRLCAKLKTQCTTAFNEQPQTGRLRRVHRKERCYETHRPQT